MTTRERHRLKQNPSPERGRGGKGSRVRQSAWCCGRNYQRWRFLHGEFPGTHHEVCVHCGKPLVWPSYRPSSKQDRARLAWREYQRRRVAALVRQGLTAKGEIRKRRATISLQELAWRDLRAEMGDIIVPEVSATSMRGDYT